MKFDYKKAAEFIVLGFPEVTTVRTKAEAI
jgi:hypothetical protein